jgi:type I restriction enzyme S subunit
MEVKRGYKQTEVGVIPEEWDVKPFAELFAFRNGVNADKAAYGQGVPFINVLEPITYSHLHGPEITGQVTLPETVVASYAVRRGDVLFNRTSETQEEVGLASTYLGSERVVFGGFVIRGRPLDERFDPVYSGYALRAPIIRSQIIPMGQGAIRANVGQQNLGLVIAPVPPLPEQRAIATALSDVDGLLGGLDGFIAKKRDLKQAAMQQLLTGQTRLPGFHGEWEVKRVLELGDVVTGGTPSTDVAVFWGEGYPWITPTDISSHRDMFSSERTLTQKGLHAIRALPANTVLVTCIASIGKNAILKTAGACNQQINAVIPTRDSSAEFLYYVFEASKQFLLANAGTTATSIISKAAFAQLAFTVPRFPEQTTIAAVLSDLDAELTALEQRREKTRALKQAMMQELLTGRTRLVRREGTEVKP